MRVAVRRALVGGKERWDARRALTFARRTCRAEPAEVWICWDLDNTLVRSGIHLQEGQSLQDAIAVSEAMPNMLALFEQVAARLPLARHFVLSARPGSMRQASLSWLSGNGLTPDRCALCLVPRAEDKARIWRELARRSRLVIVDDLSFGHEGGEPSRYVDLVEAAEGTAAVYIGLDEIQRITADSSALDEIASRVVEALAEGADPGARDQGPLP